MNRSGLFATGVAIRNFRGYGEFFLRFPASPCAVVLSGPNGLGKTSLFEAIEWALTSSVKRLDMVTANRADPYDLARRAEGVDAAEVTLSYCDAAGEEARVHRTQLVPREGAPQSHGTRLVTVAELLRSDDVRWNVNGDNLADYLHLTHLHAQVAALRLVAFSAKERWVRVSPLAGADRFERVRTNLTSSKAQLTKLRDRRAELMQAALDRRNRWTDLLRRLDQLQRVAATIRDVLAPSEAILAASGIARRIGLAAAIEWPRAHEEELSSASSALRNLRVSIEDDRAGVGERVEALGRLRILPQQGVDLGTQQASLARRVQTLEEALAGAVRTLEQLVSRTAGLKVVADERAAARKLALERHERVTRVLRDHDDLVRLDEDLREAERQAKDVDEAVELAALKLRQARDDVATVDRLTAQHSNARVQLDDVEKAMLALGEIDTLERRIGTEQTRREELVERIGNLTRDAASIADDLRLLDERTAAARQSLVDRRAGAAELQQALLAIVQHIAAHDEKCPVCQSPFAPGQLLAAARVSVKALDPGLADAEAVVRALESQREALRVHVAGLGQDRRTLAADLEAVDESLGELRARVAALIAHPLLQQASIDRAREQLERVRADRQAEIQQLHRQLEGSPPVEDLKKSVSEAGAAVDARVRARSLAHERRVAREARSNEVRARLAHLGTEYAELDAPVATLALLGKGVALEAANAKEALDAALAALSEAQAAEAAERQTIAAANQELAIVRRQSTALGAALDAIARQWREASLGEQITEAALDAELERWSRRRHELDGALAELSTLASAVERWQQTVELQEVELEVRRQHGALERNAYSEELDAAVASAEAAVAGAQRARDAADELSMTLGKVTADFGERALRPFDELFRRYLRALVHDERFHNIAAAYEPSARTAALRFRVGLGGSETDAENILSEGQLGEVSLAAMLAASTTFPWSRWKALLLDDPTQYNDLIHATALFDVLRNLIRLAGYQVFVSTHDNEQAAFLRRKLDAVGIPWVDCRYVAHGGAGIVADIRSSAER